jgi:hypothetical protein
MIPGLLLSLQPIKALPEPMPRMVLDDFPQGRDHFGISIQRCLRKLIVRRPREPNDPACPGDG